MQPGVAGGLGSERQQWVVGVLRLTAAEAAAGRRARRIAVQPFGHATDEGASLRFCAWQPAIELGDARPPVIERQPILGPSSAAGAEGRRRPPCDATNDRGRRALRRALSHWPSIGDFRADLARRRAPKPLIFRHAGCERATLLTSKTHERDNAPMGAILAVASNSRHLRLEFFAETSSVMICPMDACRTTPR
jgi:hypothetical protein